MNTEEDPDELIYAGFSKETAKNFIENFEKYLDDNKDSIEALRIIYNSEDNLQMIIAVGFKVNNERAVQFRKGRL